MRIIVERRADGFVAYWSENTNVWGFGRTTDAAIGALISVHAERFNIVVECK